jgi:hypothetical protein
MRGGAVPGGKGCTRGGVGCTRWGGGGLYQTIWDLLCNAIYMYIPRY